MLRKWKLIFKREDIDYFKAFKKLFLRERKLRKSAIQRCERRMGERYYVLSKWIADHELALNELKNEVKLTVTNNKMLNTKLIVAEGVEQKINSCLARLNRYSDKFEYIETLGNSAKQSYELYLANLKQEISRVSVVHAFTERLASLETRITLLELSHGSGSQKIPERFGSDKNKYSTSV